MIDKPIETIDSADYRALIESRTPESRTLEFKRELARGDKATAEFLRDITALANSQGGDLIIGVEEENGVAGDVPGVVIENLDTEQLRFENIIRACTEPRLANYQLRFVEVADDRHVIHFRVRPSLAAPHAVRDGEKRNYFARNGVGKHEMDAMELRHAFTASEQLIPRLRALHEKAVSASRGVHMPVRLDDEPRCIVSLIPLGFFRQRQDLPITEDNGLVPYRTRAYNFIPILEGLLAYSPIREGSGSSEHGPAVRSYALNHWAGRYDIGFEIGARRPERPQEGVVWPGHFEQGLLGMSAAATVRLKTIGVEGPWAILTTVEGLKGTQLILPNERRSTPAWRDSAVLPELVLEDITPEAMMPLFRSLWLLFGEQRPSHLPVGQDQR